MAQPREGLIIHKPIVDEARANGDDNKDGQAKAHDILPTTADEVTTLLITSTGERAQSGSRKLMKMMAKTPWMVVRAKHRSPGDKTPHVTVEVGGTRCHIRLNKAGHVFDVTAMIDGKIVRLSNGLPWVAPGDEPPGLRHA